MGKRGYFEFDGVEIPIVYKRKARSLLKKGNLTDEEYNFMLRAKAKELYLGKNGNDHEPVNLNDISVEADQHCLILNVGGKKTYHSNLESLLYSMKEAVLRNKIASFGQVKDINTLIRLNKEAEEFVKTNFGKMKV